MILTLKVIYILCQNSFSVHYIQDDLLQLLYVLQKGGKTQGCRTHLIHQLVEHNGELDGILCLPDLHLEGGPLLLQLSKVCLHLPRVILRAEHLGGGGDEGLDALLKHL